MKIHVLGYRGLVSSTEISLNAAGLVELLVNTTDRQANVFFCGTCPGFYEKVEGRAAEHRAVRVRLDLETQPGVGDTVDAWVVVEPETPQEHDLLDDAQVFGQFEDEQAVFLFVPAEAGQIVSSLDSWRDEAPEGEADFGEDEDALRTSDDQVEPGAPEELGR